MPSARTCAPNPTFQKAKHERNMNELSPHAVGALTVATEAALIDEYTSIIADAVLAENGMSNVKPTIKISVAELAEVLGQKYAFMVMRRSKFFILGDDWVHRMGYGDAVEIYVEDLAPVLHVARASLDPLGLCNAFGPGGGA